MQNSNVIKIENMYKKFKEKMVLNNINLDLKKGGIYGFIGHNGSGKTMLFRIICGLVFPSEGTVAIKENTEIGAIIENPGFLLEYSGLKNLELIATIKSKVTKEEIIKTMERVGLDPSNKAPVKTYSLGMKQKLALAQSLMESPSLLVLDEPTNGLDKDSANLIRNVLLEEKLAGKTILLTSHNNEDVNLLCDEVYELNNGKIEKIK